MTEPVRDSERDENPEEFDVSLKDHRNANALRLANRFPERRIGKLRFMYWKKFD